MSITPLNGVGTSAFQRADLEGVGLPPRAVLTLEGLPLDRDALTQTLDEVIAEVNKIDAAPLVVWEAADAQLTDTRVIADSDNVTLTADASTVKADLTDTGVVADDYGDASHVIAITVDAKGRIVSAQAFPLNSDNVTEGSTHLFYTDTRARAAISGAHQVNYNAGTGVIDTTGFSGTKSPPASITVVNGIVTNMT